MAFERIYKSTVIYRRTGESNVQGGIYRWILTGFESGSPRILKNINKKSTKEENTRCVEIAKRNGLKVKALMSIGHPGESEKTILDTRDWLIEIKPDDFDITIITTYPGTPYYDFAVRSENDQSVWVYTYNHTGDRLFSVEIDHSEVADYYKGVPGEYQAYVWTDFISREGLVNLRDEVERDVRENLNIPFNASRPAVRFEHSMGQTGPTPSFILKNTPR